MVVNWYLRLKGKRGDANLTVYDLKGVYPFESVKNLIFLFTYFHRLMS